MPNQKKNVTTVNQAFRLELKDLFKFGHIRKGNNNVFAHSISWNDSKGNETASALMYSVWNDKENYIKLDYSAIDRRTRKKTPINYKINLVSVPSNLGTGEVWYFECPVSNRRCRILYLAYNSHYFKCREAYKKRLYYSCQIVSKDDYPKNRYNTLTERYKAFDTKGKKATYKGRETTTYQKHCKLIEDLEKWDLEKYKVEQKRDRRFCRTIGRLLGYSGDSLAELVAWVENE